MITTKGNDEMINLQLTERQGVALLKVLEPVQASILGTGLQEDEWKSLVDLHEQLQTHYEAGDPDG